MSDDRSTFEMTRARLVDIVTQARRKDVSLEQSLDLLEEAVRLVNQCNDLIDQTSFRAATPGTEGAETEDVVPALVVETIEVVDVDGDGVADEVFDTVRVSEDWGTDDAWVSEPAPSAGEDDDERS